MKKRNEISYKVTDNGITIKDICVNHVQSQYLDLSYTVLGYKRARCEWF
jgi:hypothetical protein